MSEGATTPQHIAQELQRLDAMRLFLAALPRFVRLTGKTVVLKFEGVAGAEGEGVGCNVGFSGAGEEEWPFLFAQVMDVLTEEEKLQRLQLLVDEMRNVGVEAEKLDPMIQEAEALAVRLHGAPSSR